MKKYETARSLRANGYTRYKAVDPIKCKVTAYYKAGENVAYRKVSDKLYCRRGLNGFVFVKKF